MNVAHPTKGEEARSQRLPFFQKNPSKIEFPL
jgi:hypothetical protein